MLVFTLAAVLGIVAVQPAAPVGSVALPTIIDFEADVSGTVDLKEARVTDAPGSSLFGTRSLLADLSTAEGEWHEVLSTTEAVRFEPGRTYHVSFRYRVLNAGSKDTRFYSLLRSRSGGDLYNDFWQWNREAGSEGTIHRIFRPEEKDDWTFIIGVRRRGSILIDDVRIAVCSGNPPGYGLPVKPGKTDLLTAKAELDRIRAAEGMNATLADMLVVWCNEGAGDKIVTARAEYAREHNPDFVDWNDCGPLAKEFGVRTSSGGPEYQEFYKFEGPDVWGSRFQRFGDNGFAESLDGTLIQDETWGEGGYFTCHNGNGWHRWFTSELLKRNAKRLGMCQDNIAAAPFYKGHGCFCKPCLAKFRDWLRSRYTADELGAFGITDLPAFDFRERVATYGLVGNHALGDPLVREYIKFQFCSQLAAWAAVVKAVKADAVQRGFPVPCYGNQIGAFGMWPFAVAIGEFCDVIEIEEVLGVKDRIPNWSRLYKMGRASGHESKPVWVRGPVGDDGKDRTPMLSPLFWATHHAEALANGGVRDISFGMNSPWTGDPKTLDFIDSPELREFWKQYARLCDQSRAVFTNRVSLAEVALIYSLPTTMMRRYYPLDIDDNGFFSPFDETAKWLDAQHIPYDCVVFGHPEVFPTAMDQLKRYKVLVLPSADALSDIQLAFLKSFAAKGGKIIKIGAIGTRDENLNERGPADQLLSAGLIDLKAERDKALLVLKEAAPLVIEAPETVTTNLWLSAGGASVDLHLVNYDADLKAGQWRDIKPIRATVVLPAGFTYDCARLIQYGKDPQELSAYIEEAGTVSVVVPKLDSYAVVSFANRAKLDAANREARDRRERDRALVKRVAQEKDLY